VFRQLHHLWYSSWHSSCHPNAYIHTYIQLKFDSASTA